MLLKNDPIRFWGNAVQLGMMVAEANAVIAMRTMGMAGIWSVTPQENRRMLTEKVTALTKAGSDAAVAAASGAGPDVVIAAAIKPVRRATSANAKRLGKRGLKVKKG